ncbi:MAG: hypothetical protein KAU31_13310, partial [Spirochaetaceae bacterium]|nr:hypothetical protein [Spirochaetaceae bacterium]
MTLNFVGSRRVFELTVRDTNHVRRKHFFLPDVGMDDGSLEVYASTNSGGDIELDGRSFTRLQSPDDYTLDRARAWIHLSSMLSSQDLIVTCTFGGVRLGDPILGQSAYINESGVRENFSVTTHPEQFGDTAGIRYLYLNRDGQNSYWEHRGVYALEELSQISEVDLVQIDLLLTGLLESNSNYADVITEHIVDTSRGLVIFAPEDAVGFYPRPFPGLFPYTHAVSPGNPFDPANSVYSDLNAAAEADSVNTLRFRFSGEPACFTIDELFIQDSVTVRVAGRELDGGQFIVDDSTGVVSIADGIVSPESSVTIRYRRAGDQDVARSLLVAASADWSRGGFTVHGMVAVDVPFPEP